MKRFLLRTAIVVPLFFFSSLTAQAFLFNNRVDKARDFIKAKMPNQAVWVLEEEIKENPTNEEAHFE